MPSNECERTTEETIKKTHTRMSPMVMVSSWSKRPSNHGTSFFDLCVSETEIVLYMYTYILVYTLQIYIYR
jgi:hypothetical protein